jgi:hypothetical protein
MPIKLEIRENGHAFYYVYADPWSVPELLKIDAEIVAPHLSSATHKVHSVVNMKASRQIPSGLLQIRRGIVGMKHPNSGLAAIVGAPMFIQTLNDTVTRLAHFERGKLFKTEDEAWAFIRDVIAREAPTTPATVQSQPGTTA